MKAAASEALGIPAENIFLKKRWRIRRRQEGDQYSKRAQINFLRDVHEGDMMFRVNLSDYLDTGLFLDARKKRAFISDQSADKKVLNLFSYTCSLSVAAAAGGASKVESVDLSKTYLDWGKVNFSLNGINNPFLIRDDVIEFISEAKNKKQKWDLIILDPPGFSNSKKMKNAIDLKRDHEEIINNCLSLLAKNGMLIFSSGKRNLRLENTSFPGKKITDITEKLRDEDFIGKRIPLCYTIEE